ncbi:sodium-translocating pyrophosphatase [Vulgatibacter incomptus]|uniref:K(+)-insensitive pyrophosphate-energized proton pump n=1 Tax=Vulgatibacter incomptus TaxID=1391653 RepID=A0A0K1PHQ4_9BACT|nr:sodium-translocating pyrophosphatase [Vulgatibacter incomptus]AKU93055.1 Pyrophosphate-energized proton pump [Vulgatibacter incomptus]
MHRSSFPFSCRTAAARLASAAALLLPLFAASNARASEATLALPDFDSVRILGIPGTGFLWAGLVIAALGVVMGLSMAASVRKLPAHKAMLEISELIYETCKTYLQTQGRFILKLELLVGAIIAFYFGYIQRLGVAKVVVILLFSLLGIAGSYGVAWLGMRINNWANSRSAFAGLRGKPFPTFEIPLRSGMAVGMSLLGIELVLMFGILLFIPGDWAGPCFIGFAIGASLGASALRIAGGIFTKIADIGSDMMKIIFNIKEDDARNPGVIADCAGDNAGDSVGPTADGFETYGVTIVALLSFVLLAVAAQSVQVQLLVWIFAVAALMIVSSAASYAINAMLSKGRYGNADKMNFEAPLTSLVWLTSLVSIAGNFVLSYLLIGGLGDGSLWWKLAGILSCGTIAGALIPEVVKAFTSTDSAHVREVVTASREGGASLNVLAGFNAGNFSAYWMGLVIVSLMAIAYGISSLGLGEHMLAPTVFAFGLVAFGFLGMGPVTIAVDSYGPVTDNAQSVYELSLIETLPGVEASIEKEFGFRPNFEKAKDYLEENDSAGNTFKATSKPVLIGTAVVGATTLIFSIVMVLTGGLTSGLEKLSILHPPFLLGLIAGGAVIYWFTGAATQAVATGAYRAVEFIKRNIRLDGAEKASVQDSKKVVEICTTYAQKGMVNIFLTIFFSTLAFGCLEPFFFIGYLIGIAIFGLFQAMFMANAGGAWDNAKKVVEVELKAKGTPLHAATVVGDTVGDPFKDTSSVAMNPVIKFSSLFGLMAVELAVELNRGLSLTLAAIFFAASLVFVWRSFYGMRIEQAPTATPSPAPIDA